MKKLLLVLMLASSSAYADHFDLYLDINCPITKVDNTSGLHTLTNNGSQISGLGHSRLNGSRLHHPLMVGNTPAGVPMDLTTGNYIRNGTGYNAVTGIVSCHYTSGTYPPFNVFYQLHHGVHGSIKYALYGSIRLQFQFG